MCANGGMWLLLAKITCQPQVGDPDMSMLIYIYKKKSRIERRLFLSSVKTHISTAVFHYFPRVIVQAASRARKNSFLLFLVHVIPVSTENR